MPGPSRGRARHRSTERASSSRRPLRSLWAGTAVVAGAVTVALVATGGTYALWNTSSTSNAQVVRSGTAALSISGQPNLGTPLAPGQATATTFSVTNGGDVPLSMRVAVTTTRTSSGESGTGAGSLDELTLRITPVSSASDCTATTTGGYSARPAAFDTGSGYFTLPSGISALACLVLALDPDAPAATSGSVADLTITVSGTQVTS
ncbi:TasA family protein [Frigoribacterium sp. PhB24]|uniref:TasA family protein n=1 Tax=Frigoribacterium sp. PhB24 TaxID=2485204 RepID=UPI0011CD3CEB|nr:TasA family protein [Frigoribacterium sp. PhB24]